MFDYQSKDFAASPLRTEAQGLRAVGREDLAQEVTQNMQAAGYVVVASNPFTVQVSPVLPRAESSYCGRIRTLWDELRTQVLSTWTVPRRVAQDAGTYLKDAQERYVADAYHSLSIEGYHVTPDLIEKVPGRLAGWTGFHSKFDARTAATRRGTRCNATVV